MAGNLIRNENLELESLTFLKRLNLSSNQVSKLWKFPLSLEILNLSKNKLNSISDLSNSNMKKLMSLNISFNNDLKNFSGIEKSVKLSILKASDNQIDSLSEIASLSHLREIDLARNSLETEENLIIFMDLKKVKILVLTENPVFEILKKAVPDAENVINELKMFSSEGILA